MEKNYTITSHAGMHARPATVLVSSIASFQSDISLQFKEKTVNLKSIMGVLSLGIPEGATIKIIASGVDAIQAMTKIDEVFKEYNLGV